MTVWCVLVRRERNDGLYRVITYLVFKMLEELTLAFLASLIFSCIVFYGVRLQGEWVLFWLVYLVTLSCGIGETCVYCQCAPVRLSAVYLLFYSHFCCQRGNFELMQVCDCVQCSRTLWQPALPTWTLPMR